MATSPRVVAELGRPETPDETADRKAESSRVYRASQTARNLVAALVVTLAVVVVVVLLVPRGDPPAAQPVDVAAIAKQVEQNQATTVIVPTVPSTWSVNGAAVEDGAWTIVYAPPGDAGYLRVAQAFDADATWAAQELHGAAPQDTVAIDGVDWDRYRIADPSSAGNVAYALGTQAGRDHILIYGDMSEADAALVARSIADQVRTLKTEAQ